jgi:transposase
VQHIAIDLGGKESQICVRSETQDILEEKRFLTKRLGEYLAKQVASRVIVETSAEAFAVADLGRKAGHDVRVVPATLARSLGVGARGIKTDRRDAQVLSEVSCKVDLRSVHIPTEKARLSRGLHSSTP